MAALIDTFYGTGRRKTSVARVWVRPGSGRMVVNRRSFEDYLNPKWKGRIGFSDPRVPSSGQSIWSFMWELRGEELHGVRLLRPLAHLQRLRRQPLRVGEPPEEERLERPEPPGLPEVERLAQLLGQGVEAVERGGRLCDSTRLHLRHEEMLAAKELQLAIAQLPGQFDDLPRDDQTLLGGPAGRG